MKVFLEQVFELAAFNNSEPVVAGGKGLALGPDPCGRNENAGCCALLLHGAGQGADVVGRDTFAVALGLDQDLGAAHNVALVVGDGVDTSSREDWVTLTSNPIASNS